MIVEIWSDVVCPWCYVGKRRFETALAAFEHRDAVTVVWRSFELDPAAPGEFAGERAARIAEKYGRSLEQVREMERRMIDTAAAEGLDFRFEFARAGATFDAHRVIHLAREHDLQDTVKERLLRAYFTEGELLSDHATLVRLAVEGGIDGDEVREMLAGDRYAAQVREDERAAAQLGISSVPTFVIDRARGVSGAQPPAELLELLRQGWNAGGHETLVAVGETGAAGVR